MINMASTDIPAAGVARERNDFVEPIARSLEAASAPASKADAEITLERGDFLFREGDRKTHLYRLETGILCVTSRRANGPPHVIEMVFPGGLLSLGFLERYIYSAMAVVPCRVAVLPLETLTDLCRDSAEVRDRQALAAEREFAARRRELVPDTDELPVRRLAAFLSAMHHMNRREGRNPNLIPEFLKTGDVASFLDLDVDALARALTELQERGLVSRADGGGLLLLDAGGLEELAPDN